MEPDVWIVCVVALATLVLGYCGLKTYQDIKARKWLSSSAGLVITLAVPPLLLMVANLMWHLVHHGAA